MALGLPLAPCHTASTYDTDRAALPLVLLLTPCCTATCAVTDAMHSASALDVDPTALPLVLPLTPCCAASARDASCAALPLVLPLTPCCTATRAAADSAHSASARDAEKITVLQFTGAFLLFFTAEAQRLFGAKIRQFDTNFA